MPIDLIFQDLPANTVPVNFLFGDIQGVFFVASNEITTGVGSISASVTTSLEISGNSSDVLLGTTTVSKDITVDLTGEPLSVDFGIVGLSVSVSQEITGNQIDFSAGGVTSSSTTSLLLDSVNSDISLNNLTSSITTSESLTGVDSSSYVNGVTTEVGSFVDVNGNSSSVSPGDLLTNSTSTLAIYGNHSTGEINFVDAIVGNFVSIDGIFATLGEGSLETNSTSNISITGEKSDTSVGDTIVSSRVVLISGVSADATINSVLIIEGGSLIGFTAKVLAGSVCALKDYDLVLTGSAATGQLGGIDGKKTLVVPLTFRESAWAESPAIPTLKSADLSYLEIDANFKTIQDNLQEPPLPTNTGASGRRVVQVYENFDRIHNSVNTSNQIAVWRRETWQVPALYPTPPEYIRYEHGVTPYRGYVLQPDDYKNTILNFNNHKTNGVIVTEYWNTGLSDAPSYVNGNRGSVVLGSGYTVDDNSGGENMLCLVIPCDELYEFPIGTNVIVTLNGDNIGPGTIRIVPWLGDTGNPAVMNIHCYPMAGSNGTSISNSDGLGIRLIHESQKAVGFDGIVDGNTCSAMVIKTGFNEWQVIGEALLYEGG